MIRDLFMGLILMFAAYFTGGFGLGIGYITEHYRKKIKKNTGKENERFFFILNMIIYMIYQFFFYLMMEVDGILSFYWSILGSWIYFEFLKSLMIENIEKTGGNTNFFSENKETLYSILVIFCIINIIVYECIT